MELHLVDRRMLLTERDALMPTALQWESLDGILDGIEPYDSQSLTCWQFAAAKAAFLHRFDELCGCRNQTEIHGSTCRKVSHDQGVGYLHGEDDDTPYNVDGLNYCGRCHRWLGA